jgi:hypothetical protein
MANAGDEEPFVRRPSQNPDRFHLLHQESLLRRHQCANRLPTGGHQDDAIHIAGILVYNPYIIR